MDIIQNYIKEIPFQEIKIEHITTKDLISLDTKEGIIIPSETTTPLWIHRQLSVQHVLNSPVVMESTKDYEIRDSFGYTIWTGDSESVIEYVKAFYSVD